MKIFTHSAVITVVAALGVTITAVPAAKTEVVLRSVTGLPAQSVVSQVFLRFVGPANQRGKGLVRIDNIGGPEIAPPFKQASALKRGLFEMLYTPAAFYAGQVKEVDALIASNVSIQEMRANGGFALLQKIWAEQLGVHVLGWFDAHVRFHMYFKKKPKITAAGADLSGIKMFTTPTFREFQAALGATPVRMKVSEILTGMDRGLIQGMGWPEYGMTALGLGRVIKYRLDPTYYRGNILTLVNGDAWKKLPNEAKAFLNKEVIAYEAISKKFVDSQILREQGILMKGGMEVLKLEGEAARKYRQLAHDIAWKRLERRSPQYAKQLRALLYDPNR